MKHHEITQEDTRHVPPHRRARCSCQWRSEDFVLQDDVDEAIREHLREVTASLIASSRPSPKTTARYYRAQSEDMRFSAKERRQWAALAEEMEDRVDSTTRDDTLNQDPLF